MKSLLFFVLFSTHQTLFAELWPVSDDCAKAEKNVVTKSIEIAAKDLKSVKFEITSKGNGSISLPGLNVRIFDVHDDGLIFENSLLKCEWKDSDADGFLDIVVSGIAIKTGENEEDYPIKIMVSGEFRWNPLNKQFEVIRCSPEIYTWK